MKRFFAFIAVLLLTAACGGGEEHGDHPAAVAARDYYRQLFDGRYVDYLAGFNRTGSLPPGYREQLLVNAKQFVAQQKEVHGGVADIRVVTAKEDSLNHKVDAFLMICFNDSAKEEIVVPMMQKGDRWLMK